MSRGRSFVNREDGGLRKKAVGLTPDQVAKLLGKPTVDELRAAERAGRIKQNWLALETDQQRINEAAEQRRKKESTMTVSLYKSLASGAREIVVQTNAQSLDLFIAGLAEAMHGALIAEPEAATQLIASTLKNAFPVAFAIAGYKADKVSESKLLTCGTASPGASELVAQSKV